MYCLSLDPTVKHSIQILHKKLTIFMPNALICILFYILINIVDKIVFSCYLIIMVLLSFYCFFDPFLTTQTCQKTSDKQCRQKCKKPTGLICSLHLNTGEKRKKGTFEYEKGVSHSAYV